MLNKTLDFIKYNNATVIILALVLILGGGALAAGPEAIGQKETFIQGVDNAALLGADLTAFNMDFKIEKIEQDEKYYYVSYSFLDLVLAENAWQYRLSAKTQKISKKIQQDIGAYMVKFLAKHYEARVRELKLEKNLAAAQGEQKRVEVIEYSGLVGRTLNLAAAVFPGYEPVVKRELPAPENFNLPALASVDLPAADSASADNLTKIYNDYIAAHPELLNPPAGQADPSLPPAETGAVASSTPPLVDPAVPEVPAEPEMLIIPEPASVNIIDLPPPAPEAVPLVEPAPAE